LPKNRTIALAFERQQEKPRGKRPGRRTTICDIWETVQKDGKLVTANLITSATAVCSRQDVFNKEKGRKSAITFALAATGDETFSKEDREVIWTTYFNRPRPKDPKAGQKPEPVIDGEVVESDVAEVLPAVDIDISGDDIKH
jgi:hypothetical protein